MPLNIIRADISKVKADAIVNTANPEVAIGAGVDKAIYDAAGAEQLLAERAKIGPMKPGQAASTPAFNLDAKYIIHTVGPAWEGGEYGEREAVASCYKESLKIADELDCDSIAFPLISTGTYGFPKDEALQIAIREISSFLFEHDMNVTMVVYDPKSFIISSKAFADVKSYIDDDEVEYQMRLSEARRRRRQRLAGRPISKRESWTIDSSVLYAPKPAPDIDEEADESIDLIEEVYEANTEPDVAYGVNMAPVTEAAAAYSIPHSDEFGDMDGTLDDIIRRKPETFQELLFRHINRKDLTDPDVYHKANIDRKLFSKIRNPKYTPSKKTAIALAIALELNLDETLDLIGRAGYTLSPASTFDRIVYYCIVNKIYDIFWINTLLFKYTEQVLAV